jgi:hypothetical protein
VTVGVPMLTTELETVDFDPELARLTPNNAAPAPAATMAASTIHFLWLPDPILAVVGVISPDLAVPCAGVVSVISPDFGMACGTACGALGGVA